VGASALVRTETMTRYVIDVERFNEAVWAVERENFRPGDALAALDRARVDASDWPLTPDDLDALRVLLRLPRSARAHLRTLTSFGEGLTLRAMADYLTDTKR
jgi:hypothetical protein